MHNAGTTFLELTIENNYMYAYIYIYVYMRIYISAPRSDPQSESFGNSQKSAL